MKVVPAVKAVGRVGGSNYYWLDEDRMIDYS